MKYNLRKGLYLLMAILCVGWAQAQTIASRTELQNAINSAEENGTVTLTGDIENVTQAITIDRALTLDGKGYTISGNVGWSSALLNITGTGEVTIKNLTVANNADPASAFPPNPGNYADISIERNDNSAVSLIGVTLGGNATNGIDTSNPQLSSSASFLRLNVLSSLN